jgi:hypothetical protein
VRGEEENGNRRVLVDKCRGQIGEIREIKKMEKKINMTERIFK